MCLCLLQLDYLNKPAGIGTSMKCLNPLQLVAWHFCVIPLFPWLLFPCPLPLGLEMTIYTLFELCGLPAFLQKPLLMSATTHVSLKLSTCMSAKAKMCCHDCKTSMARFGISVDIPSQVLAVITIGLLCTYLYTLLEGPRVRVDMNRVMHNFNTVEAMLNAPTNAQADRTAEDAYDGDDEADSHASFAFDKPKQQETVTEPKAP